MHHGQLLPHTLILLDVHSFYALHLPVLVTHDVVWFFKFSICAVSLPSRQEFAHTLCDSPHGTKSGKESSSLDPSRPAKFVARVLPARVRVPGLQENESEAM